MKDLGDVSRCTLAEQCRYLATLLESEGYFSAALTCIDAAKRINSLEAELAIATCPKDERRLATERFYKAIAELRAELEAIKANADAYEAIGAAAVRVQTTIRDLPVDATVSRKHFTQQGVRSST